MLKRKLAQHAGVSSRTFSRWLQKHRTQLEELGVKPNDRILPPQAVKYLCETFWIDIE